LRAALYAKGIMKLPEGFGRGAGRTQSRCDRPQYDRGAPVAKLLLDENATVTITHSRTKNLADVTREAEILVVAIGRPKFVTADMVGDGAVVIDVGVNRDPETGKLCGDVDFEACEPKASLITKVPGGVGPMTIACLIENTIEAFLKKVAK
ncbi:bifunctional methylenetetrahydrofolate dehydrogenase/methylenetetrahydrofolate cyclohydrolase, partial [human gut metagenome]